VAFVELRSLRREFGETVALDGIDLSLEQGEFLSLLGPSGCGKTTALRIVAGFDRPDAGTVLVGGKDMTRIPPNKRDMGMVFQAYSLFPNMTAERNVEFGLKIRGLHTSNRRGKVEELLELVGLGHARKRYPHQLSGGMQQRVALARALAIEPRVLLLDEPLSALDAKVRVQLREKIRRIQSRLGITTIYVTHDQEEALSISDRVAVLSQGHIEQVGPPGEIYDDPATPFVADFVGTMNRLEGTVEGDGIVAYGETRLAIAAARGRAQGERVMVLVRPETVELGPTNGDGTSSTITGEIISHTFLGANMRLKIAGATSDLTADVPASRAGAYPVGMRVQAHFPGETARVLTLEELPAPAPVDH